jgi:hypothetical protein
LAKLAPEAPLSATSSSRIRDVAPVELILVEEEDGRCSLTYVRPSSLMVVETNDGLLAAARQLDAKLQALATKVTSA